MERENNILAFDAAITARRIDENGFMHVDACPISKATVNPYLGREIPNWQDLGLNPERVYYGLRDPEELAKAAPTFNGLPLMQGHHDYTADAPPKEYQVGSTGTEARFEEPYLLNALSITDKKAIKSVEDGSCKQISCSYRYTPDMTAGEYKGAKYDFVMRDIRGNHVALVPQGRAGSDVVVSDSLPVEIEKTTKGEKKQMKNLSKDVLSFKRRKADLQRVIFAKDADLGIEAAEVVLANLQKAVNVVEAQVEGYDPREIGLDVDADISIDDLVDKFFTGLEAAQKDTIKAKLLELKGGEGMDEKLTYAKGVSKGEELEKNPAERAKLDREHERKGMEEYLAKKAKDEDKEEKAEDDELEERMKDPAFKAGFEMGIKAGERYEKDNPKRIDRDHEREGEEKYLAKDALPALLANAKAEAEKNVMERVKKLNAAANACAFALGNVDAMAYDSAEDIYARALQAKGIDTSKYPKESYKAMVDVLQKQRFDVTHANDEAIKKFNVSSEKTPEYMKNLKNITIR
jgi:hypothetical protein